MPRLDLDELPASRDYWGEKVGVNHSTGWFERLRGAVIHVHEVALVEPYPRRRHEPVVGLVPAEACYAPTACAKLKTRPGSISALIFASRA